jgi:PAS domain S-box-containing protein
MPELSIASPPILALVAFLLPCVTSALTALVAWYGFLRLHENTLREIALAFVVVAIIQAVLLSISIGGVASGSLLHVLDCVSAVMLGWAFLGRARRAFLIGSLSVCGVLGAFTASLWQLTGAEIAWAAQLWRLIAAVIYGVTLLALWTRRHDQPLMLLAAFAFLMSGALIDAAGLAVAAVILRLVAFPLLLVAVVQVATRDLESAQSELRSFSEHSLRQTQQLLTLLRASTTFLTHADVAKVLREAVEGVALGLGADSALIGLLDETAEHALLIQALYPPMLQLRGSVIPLSSQPAIADAIQLRRQVNLTPSQRGIHALAALMGSSAGPALIQPMLCQGRVLGVIVALNGKGGRVFSESELRVMEAFGAQVAAAAENALLDQVIETQTRELAESLSLREEEANRRAAILQSIADGVIVFDHHQQAVLANPAACNMLNLIEANVLGRNLQEIMDGHAQPDDYALVRARIEGGQPLPPGFQVVWGSRTVALSVAPVSLGSAGRHGAVVVLHDVTQEAEVDRLKSEFVSVVSHELRTPFAGLDSSMQLIQRYGLEHLLPEQREQLDQLAGGLVRARTMVNDLVTVASFLSKQGQLQMAALDVGQLAREVVQALGPMAQTRGVTLTSQIAESLPAMYGDRERLSEAIYHLLHNAIKFNRPGGSATLSCHAVPEGLVVKVTDTGVGIPPEKLPELWQEFTQLADPLRRGVEGLGLGLPLVQYVVKAHGGQVWARSQPGQGSVFGFNLPVGAQPPS